PRRPLPPPDGHHDARRRPRGRRTEPAASSLAGLPDGRERMESAAPLRTVIGGALWLGLGGPLGSALPPPDGAPTSTPDVPPPAASDPADPAGAPAPPDPTVAQLTADEQVDGFADPCLAVRAVGRRADELSATIDQARHRFSRRYGTPWVPPP